MRPVSDATHFPKNGAASLRFDHHEENMKASKYPRIWATFQRRGQAEAAIDELRHAGFTPEQVGWAVPGEGVRQARTPAGKVEDAAGKGALVGSAAGGALGAVGGALISVLFPGIGPVLTGGILTAIAGSIAAGAAGGAYLGPFVAMGLSQENASRYARALKEGRTLVAVQASDRSSEVTTTLRTHGGNVLEPLDSYVDAHPTNNGGGPRQWA